MKHLILTLLLNLSDFFSLHEAAAQEMVMLRKVKAGTYVSPPFVIKESEGWYTGMAVELWEMIEKELYLSTQYIEYNSWEHLMQALTAGEIDVAVSNLTVTYERAQLLLFSFPWYDAGMRIMVRKDQRSTFWSELKNSGRWEAYAWLFLIVIAATVILTIIYRRKKPDFPKSWREGLSLSFYNLMIAVRTGAMKDRDFTWIGRILAVGWMFFGIAFVAYITSRITTSMTKVALTTEINTLYDLPGKSVGTADGSAAEEYLERMAIQTVPFDHIEEAADALLNNEIQAVVGDAPVLEYWANINKDKNIKVVGSLFHPDKYAFAANKGQKDLMELITLELIKLYDTERIRILKDKYFGIQHP